MARILVLAVALLPAPALAQAYNCAPPARIAPVDAPRPDGPPRRVPVAGYTLAASWSPEFCRGRQDASMQCSGQQGRFGFVLHGLWPEARQGPPPQWCAATPRPSAAVIRANLCLSPEPRLIEHEWAKHGSCMVKTPDAYYRVAGILWRSLRWPDAPRLSRNRDLTAGDLRRAFVAANPDWQANQIGLVLSRTGWLREMRLCYGRDYMPTRCDRRAFGPSDSAGLKIWRGG